MNRGLSAVAMLLLATTIVWADKPVTSKDVPSPGPEQSRLWSQAIAQVYARDRFGSILPLSEPASMYSAVMRDEKLGPGVGWYGPSGVKRDWSWLAARYDANGDRKISQQELPGSSERFRRLDRNRDGVITSDDLDWSQRSDWVRRDEHSLRLLRAMDSDGNGRVTEAEWVAYFRRLAGEEQYLNAEDFRDAFAAERGEQGGKGKKVSKQTWLRALLAGDLGSPFEGPRVDQLAPDFTLPTHDGKKQIMLSEFRGKKPVVLTFGSFT